MERRHASPGQRGVIHYSCYHLREPSRNSINNLPSHSPLLSRFNQGLFPPPSSGDRHVQTRCNGSIPRRLVLGVRRDRLRRGEQRHERYIINGVGGRRREFLPFTIRHLFFLLENFVTPFFLGHPLYFF